LGHEKHSGSGLFIFKPKIPIWVNLALKKLEIFYNISWPFGIL
jgi:hypothetical protein